MKAAFLILPLCLSLAVAGCKDEKSKDTPQAPDAPAAAAPAPAPAAAAEGADAFVYQGEPIDPICFNQPMDADPNAPVSLAACSDPAQKPAGTASTREDGTLEYEMTCEEGCMRQPFVAYRHIGMSQGHHVVLVEQSGGGTGYFSDVRLVDYDGQNLRTVKSLAGGDRCNGGITGASVAGGRVHYAQQITPYDLLTLSGGNPGEAFKAYDDIPSCAACCVGEANYVDGALQSVSLSEDRSEGASAEPGAKEACFLEAYSDIAVDEMDPAALAAFGQSFQQRCAQLAKP